ncbi:MAG: proteasome subunit alpha [Acidimicrobiia bacterium]
MSMPIYVPPEQLVKDRAEYARKGIARGKSIAAVQCEGGALLLAENPSKTLHKISEIYDRIAFAGVGRYNEFDSLRVAGIRHADIKGYMYGRPDVEVRGLANAFAQTLGNIFTHEVKPYEVEILVVGIHEDGSDMFKVLYDGTLSDEHGVGAIGGQADDLVEHLREGYEDGLSVDAALDLAKSAFRALNGERDIEGWEGAVLDKGLGRRTFRRLTVDELAD